MVSARASGYTLSETSENYLKAIYQLRSQGGLVSTSALADHFGVAPASVTGMLKQLAKEEPALVEYKPRYGVKLTALGKTIALEMLRHHRLIEVYLHEELGYTWDEVHAEADRLEHVISERFENRIASVLGNPAFDPHGAPIPTRDGKYSAAPGGCLSNLHIGQSGRVARVAGNDDTALLRYLADLGIVPNAIVTVTERAPFGGPLHVRVGNQKKSHAVGERVTNSVYVEIES